MKKLTPTLHQLRRKAKPFEKFLIQEVWEHFCRSGEWPFLRVLYSSHGKVKTKRALLALGGNIGWEETHSQRWSRYRLSLLGTMITKDGPSFLVLLEKFFEYERGIFQKEPAKSYSTSSEIARVLNLGDEETVLLGQLLWLGNFGGSQGPEKGQWGVTAMEEAADFPQNSRLSAQVEEWLLRHYEPDVPVFQDQRGLGKSRISPSPNVSTTTLAQSLPVEITTSLNRLKQKYPDANRLGFLIMRFTNSKPYKRIVKIIKNTAEEHGLIVIRADETEFHAHLWENIQTLLHGCGFGIAIYDRIESNESNANVGLEVGYLMAMKKPVLLLKDKTLGTLQSDLAGRLYKNFDPHNPENTIPGEMNRWLEDNGITVSKGP